MTDYERFVKMLETAGYEISEEDPTQLGHKEYAVGAGAGKRILSVGAGRSGDEFCYTNFYFTLDSGEFVEHAANHDDSGE